MSTKRYDEKSTQRKIYCLKIGVFLSLVCSTILFGWLSYYVFYNGETKLLDSQYKYVDRDVKLSLLLIKYCKMLFYILNLDCLFFSFLFF